jgi:hypothetical protein
LHNPTQRRGGDLWSGKWAEKETFGGTLHYIHYTAGISIILEEEGWWPPHEIQSSHLIKWMAIEGRHFEKNIPVTSRFSDLKMYILGLKVHSIKYVPHVTFSRKG